MPRSYFRTLPDLYERKAFGTDKHPPYPPVALACFMGVLCFAEQQPERGRFKSSRVLVALLEGPHGKGRMIAKQLPFLVARGDVIEQPDGSLYVEGWDELQEGNWQVAERMQRYRDRRKTVTPTVTVAVTPTVTVVPRSNPSPVTDDPSRVEAGADSGRQRAVDTGRGRPPDEDDDPEHPALVRLAEWGASVPPNGNGIHRKLIDLVRRRGIASVLAALDEQHRGDPKASGRQLVFGAEDALDRPLAKAAGHKGHHGNIEEVNRAFGD